MAALTLYGTNVANGTLTTATNLVNATGGTEQSALTTINSNGGTYAEMSGVARTVNDFSAPQSPDGHGFVYSPGAGSFDTSNWSAKVTVGTNGALQGLTVRAYKYSSGTYTAIVTLTFTGNPASGKTTITVPASAGAATTFASGDLVYVDLWYFDNQLTADGDNPTLYTGNSAGGVINDVQITTANFTAGGGSVNGSATVFAFAGILGGVAGLAALPTGINAGPGLGGGINAAPALGGGIVGQGELQASSASLNNSTLEGQGNLGGGLAASGNAGTGQAGSSGLSTGLSGIAGFIQGLAGQGIIPAVSGTLGGAIHGIATLLAEAGFWPNLFGGQGLVQGSSASANYGTVTGSGNVQPNFLAGITQVVASSVAAAIATISGQGIFGTPAATGQGEAQASSAATPTLGLGGNGSLAGGLIAGIADIIATGGLLRLHPFSIAITAIKGLLNLGFSVKPALSTAFSVKPLLSFAFSVAPKLSAAFAVKPLLSFIFQPEPAVAQPNSSIQVIATLTDINGNPVTSAATCNVIVTFPDGTTSSFSLGTGVTNNGNGTYTLSYNTKTPGPHTEDWSATDATGNKTEYHHLTPVSF